MPFTISHAAAAAPLSRIFGGRLVVSAVVAGTMAPDFEYLVHLSARRTVSHTLAGQFVMCLPLALAALVLWHRLVAPAWGPLLTGRPAQPFSFGGLGRFAAVAGSALAGSFSHLAWDAFTHQHGLVVRHVGFLAAPTGVGGLRVYSLLQYASSAGGAVALAVWAHRHLGPQWSARRRRPPGPAPTLPLGLTALVALAGAGGNALRVAEAGATLTRTVAAGSIGAMAAGTAALLACSAYVVTARGLPLRP